MGTGWIGGRGYPNRILFHYSLDPATPTASYTPVSDDDTTTRVDIAPDEPQLNRKERRTQAALKRRKK